MKFTEVAPKSMAGGVIGDSSTSQPMAEAAVLGAGADSIAGAKAGSSDDSEFQA